MDTRSFPVTEDQLDQVAAFLRGHGLQFDPSIPTGEQKQGGWDIAWSIESPPLTLTITLVQHPFLESSAFWAKVGNVLKPV